MSPRNCSYWTPKREGCQEGNWKKVERFDGDERENVQGEEGRGEGENVRKRAPYARGEKKKRMTGRRKKREKRDGQVRPMRGRRRFT